MELMEAVHKRKAYRVFDPMEITDRMVEELMAAAQRAPSCNNNQPWRFIFIREKEKLDQIKATLSRGNYWGERASMIVAIASRPELDCRNDEGDYNWFDTGMASLILMLKATEMGIASHPIAGFDHSEARRILEVPEDYRLPVLIIMGKKGSDLSVLTKDWQKEKEDTRSERRPLEQNHSMDRFYFPDG